MCEEKPYRLRQTQKEEIAQNLIDILCQDAEISKEARTFVYEWVCSDRKGKTKAFYDVWDIVLKNYMPETRPILFHSCRRPTDGKIASFSGRWEFIERYSERKGSVVICDTAETLTHNFYKEGEYRHTFYPLVRVIEKIIESGNDKTKSFMSPYLKEDEYMMRVDLEWMSVLKWSKKSELPIDAQE
ncbi:hypothetical protein LJC45_00810 [Alistipes sp. OttesenSCG-928-B03]|nr:hypothetical protein [Alistipes sp. OttesenSCG-928-B03]